LERLLCNIQKQEMTLQELNNLPAEKRKSILMKCCASNAWAERMIPLFPFEDLIELIETAEEQWFLCKPEDWKEAFAGHPKIGASMADKVSVGSSDEWAAEEQKNVNEANEYTLNALADYNRKYLEKFGYIFIVNASGKTADEMLGILTTRLRNEPSKEISIAAEEQNKITRNRLEKIFL
jgi:2-oxo-4-hydroxy-4-carboxy-5-ureidoimidazoline decarboxylase